MLKLIETINEAQQAIDQVPVEKKLELTVSLVALSKKLLSSIAELGLIPSHFHNDLMPAAQAQLLAAEKRTEFAADKFLGAAEKLSELAGKVTDAQHRNALQDQVNVIFEAANFQDLVAQHLNEVKLRLNGFVNYMDCLEAALAGDEERLSKSRRHISEAKDTLLNGPTTSI